MSDTVYYECRECKAYHTDNDDLNDPPRCDTCGEEMTVEGEDAE